jgi:hypothetical protein
VFDDKVMRARQVSVVLVRVVVVVVCVVVVVVCVVVVVGQPFFPGKKTPLQHDIIVWL